MTELKKDISTYAGLRFRLLRLMVVERAALLLAVLSHCLILLLLSFVTVLFLFVALGFYLGEVLDSPALGFLIVGGIYMLLVLLVGGMKNSIRIRLTNTVIEILEANDDENDKDQSPVTPRADQDGKEGNPPLVSGNGNKNFR